MTCIHCNQPITFSDNGVPIHVDGWLYCSVDSETRATQPRRVNCGIVPMQSKFAALWVAVLLFLGATSMFILGVTR